MISGVVTSSSKPDWFEDYSSHWRGGPFAQIELGYRFGNHIFATFGWRYQAKTKTYAHDFIAKELYNQKYLTLGFGIIM